MNEIEVIRQNDVAPSTPEAGLLRQVLAFNTKLMLVRHQMGKGWRGALHRHPHDQLVYVINGRLRFIAGGRSFELAAGDSFVVPGDVEHQAEALEKSEVLDVFHPYREDYATEKK
jgi:quercetin dioxygenase-like cupin family protein